MNGINTNKGYLKLGIRIKFQSIKVAESLEGSLPTPSPPTPFQEQSMISEMLQNTVNPFPC